ncbi:putative MATE family efflux protein [Hamadaea flava]|uniref:MATE family efflux transporter n=1 Tax=Hamadaea flava TaxID=1742688 RepID=A0ABV8LKH7_9ACTN|nr:MATE family efflux transporter [Hamadaea flava]MCP2324858.1 putative MATE family efflux protein [Hamadaea flava]
MTPSLRRIAALALPALVVLAAEPLYLLVDTAVVGHLGRVPLAALAIGGTILAVTAWLGNVLAYGTTGRAARSFGAGSRRTAVEEGVQASWLALAAGLVFVVCAQLFAGPVTRALSGDPEIAEHAELWLRIASLGIPFVLLVFAGNGWMRGVQDTRRPLRYVLGANVLSAILCPLLVYPAGLGLVGSALANVAAQVVGGALFIRALVAERVPLAPRLVMLRQQLVLGRDLLVRGLAFQLCFLSAAAVAARFGAAAVAAHQVGLQLWMFCAYALDAIAIAAQSLIGAALGAGDVLTARRTAIRIGQIGLGCGVIFGIFVLALAPVLPHLFSDDTDVLGQLAIVWPWFIGMLPLNGVVFALDGVLVGAGDARYLRNLTIVAALGGFLPAIWLALWLDLGIGGVWAGLTLFIVLRLGALLLRLRDGSWAVPGAARA